MRAIISVYDKTGLAPFAQGLSRMGVEIFSTGGTHKALLDGGLPARSISDLTAFPEILDGRVKTLHPAVHGGILARRDLPDHMAQIARHGIEAIDLVAVNLYPFLQTVRRKGVTLADALENIDIGGPTLIRAAAKNFPHVVVVVDPGDYEMVGRGLAEKGLDMETRQRLAQKAFQHVALYDTAIARYLSREDDLLPVELTLGIKKLYDLRYGENPHQKGTFYADILGGEGGIAGARQLGGKELSFNNILDADAAWNVVSDFDEPAVAVIKHTNPCGLACHSDLAEAYRRALAGDPVSAFGGIVASNRLLTMAAAEEIAKVFYEIVLAPGFEPEAFKLLQQKKNLRLLEVGGGGEKEGGTLDFRRVRGGVLLQTRDAIAEDPGQWKTVTRRRPTSEEMSDLSFAWKAVKHVKSNAIVLVRDKALVGMGAGQPNRVTSVHLALRAAGERARGSVLASDAFFPFADNVELAAGGGITAMVQPGGSVRDQEVIAAADSHGIAMLFTGVRHFKH